MNLQVFQNNEFEVRTAQDERGEVLFCLADICKVLEIKNASDVKNAILREFELARLNLASFNTGYGIKEFTMIDESQLYFVLGSSRSHKARPFRMWINKEVLPALRQKGIFALKPLTLKESLQAQIKLIEANEALEARNKSLALENQKLELEKAANEPLIHFAKAIESTQGAILMRDFAKILYEKERLEIGEKRLFAFLRDKGYLMSDNKPYQCFVQNGLFRLSELSIQTIKGARLVTTTKITGKGQIAITKALLKEYATRLKKECAHA